MFVWRSGWSYFEEVDHIFNNCDTGFGAAKKCHLQHVRSIGQRYFLKETFRKISQNLQENVCDDIFFSEMSGQSSKKLQAGFWIFFLLFFLNLLMQIFNFANVGVRARSLVYQPIPYHWSLPIPPENIRCSDVFRGSRKRPVAQNELKTFVLNRWLLRFTQYFSQYIFKSFLWVQSNVVSIFTFCSRSQYLNFKLKMTL